MRHWHVNAMSLRTRVVLGFCRKTMANRTVKDAHSVKGTNPQYLVEKITRTRIYESRYWKEECFALTAELMVDKAMELKYIGGVYGGNIKPTPFLCLILKMLQIQPDKDIIVEFISNADFKYVRALGALYMRLVGTSLDCYKYLEPLYNDYRKLKKQNRDGSFEMIYMDEYIDQLLREERMFDIILPRVQKRPVLEETNQLEPRVSFLDEEMEEMDTSDEEEGQNQHKSPEREPSPPDARTNHRDWHRAKRSPSPQHRRNRSRSPHGRNRRADRERERGDRDRERRRSRSRSRERHREKKRRSRSRSRDRDRGHKRQEGDERRRHHKSKKSKHERRDKEEKEKGLPQEDLEIKEANELRAKLGLPPLRP